MSSKIPLNSLLRHIAPMQDALSAAADSVVRSGYYVLGPHVKDFENAFATYCGAEHCIGVANGTDALELSLRGVGVSRGDRVAVIANAAMYSTSAVLAIGAVPVFVDVGDDSTMDPAALSAVIERTGIRAVVLTHLYGRLADVDTIGEIAKTAGAWLVEDCAQAHGAKHVNGRVAGSFGDAASFSFYPTKNLGALGDGGAVVTSRAEVASRVRQLRQYGWGEKYRNEMTGGRNSRLDEMQAAFLNLMLPLLDGWNTRRREIANLYSNSIRHSAIEVPPNSGVDSVAHLYVVRCEDRERLGAHLLASGVGTDVHYPVPDYHQPCFEAAYASLHLPNTERDAQSVLSLPCFPELTDAEVEQVVDACNRF